MPAVLPTARYYPRLSEIVTIDDLPEFLSFVEDGLNRIFDSIHYKNLQYSKSYRGDSAFYSLDIVSPSRIQFKLPFGINFVLNPDYSGGDSTISSFPITLQYQWEILAFLKQFQLSTFSFSLEDFYSLGLQVFRITDEQVLAHTFNYFVEPATPLITKYQQIVDDINGFYGFTQGNGNLLELPPNTEASIDAIVTAVKQHPQIDKSVSMLSFAVYVLDTGSIENTKDNLNRFYNKIVPEGIEAYIRKIIKPKAKATLELSAALEFPRNILKPVYDQFGNNPYNNTSGQPFSVIV